MLIYTCMDAAHTYIRMYIIHTYVCDVSTSAQINVRANVGAPGCALQYTVWLGLPYLLCFKGFSFFPPPAPLGRQTPLNLLFFFPDLPNLL